MRPDHMDHMDHMDHIEMLRIARARAEELRQDWQAANHGRPGHARTGDRRWNDVMRPTREAAGRALIGLGRRLLPAEIGPCS